MSRKPSIGRVVILVENLPVPLDRRVWLEATTLRDAGWQVVIIGPRGDRGMRRLRETLDGIEVLRYPQHEAAGLSGYLVEYLPSMVFTAAWLLWARLTGPVDVVHGCNPPDLFWVFGLVGRLWGARYVYDEHDPNPELSATKFGRHGLKGRFLNRLTLMLEAASFRTASLVLTVNDTCRDLILGRSGLDERDVLVLMNAPDVGHVRRLAAGTEPEGRRIGYVGVMGTHDGLEVLADAWALVKGESDMGDAVLDLVGDGPARGRAEVRVRKLGVTSSVRFHGFQPPSVYVPILARCVAGVSPDLPTLFNNLASMVKLMDYMAIGRVCVTFRLTESSRMAGPALVIAEPANSRGLADALLGILRNAEEAGRLGDAASKRLDELDLRWDPYGEALVDAYRSLVNNHRA